MHKDKVGSVGGAMHGLANISGIIGPLVTGLIVSSLLVIIFTAELNNKTGYQWTNNAGNICQPVHRTAYATYFIFMHHILNNSPINRSS